MTKYITLISLTLISVIIAVLFFIIPSYICPDEDASILFRYSENLANTGVISYNTGSNPTEGATDFLWMIIISIFYKIGFKSLIAATTLSAISIIITAVLILKFYYPGQSLNNLMNVRKNYLTFSFILFLLIFLSFTPATMYGFSFILFGLLNLLVFYFFIKDKPVALFTAALINCLIRPDGIGYSLPLLILFLFISKNGIKKNLINFLVLFIVPGFIYFIWRYNYFGLLLPLPYYVKSNFEQSSKINLFYFNRFIFYCSPLIALSIYNFMKLDKKSKIKYFLIFTAAILIPFIFYSFFTLIQNICNRFQYPLVMLIVVFTIYLNKNSTNSKLLKYALLISWLMMLPKTISNFAGILDMPYEQVNYISKDIGKLNTYGKLAVTDAGKLPYYSKWYTVDLFGLNTPEMAKSMVQPGFVDQYQPDLIELYAYPQDYSFMEDRNKITPVTKKDWYGIALNIYKGCDSNKYEPYLVPFYCRKISEVKENLSFLDNAFEYFFNIRNSFNTKTSLEGYYNLYIIRKDYEHYKELKQILLKYSGKSYQEYKRIMSYE